MLVVIINVNYLVVDLFDSSRGMKRRTFGSGHKPWKKPKLDKQHSERFKKSIPGHKKEGKGNKFQNKGKSNNIKSRGKPQHQGRSNRGQRGRK